ncbi:AAA ATPase domain-containing protein [Reticulomyxa filosa]|uniref:GPN-loop GTPase n=1 Tax=Reticulomyxa filosa TaxID=46433 RepID=X6M6W3_RETFI|nr:AAA ATPase domain-containing protein [Reticulomyxa filosa]|eukprot:ETO08765.1 AAA ATPase domain-containing protein [Reticulomyxa filosa]
MTIYCQLSFGKKKTGFPPIFTNIIKKKMASATPSKKPVICLVIGMAGSGKTTLMQRLSMHVNENKIPSYFINLDPAVHTLHYEPHIDIRDTVKYKNVMKEFQLGPNGAILTSLNLFSTKFDQVLNILEKRSDSLDYIFIDTPGQIEVFIKFYYYYYYKNIK